DLPSPVHERALHLVALRQELARMAGLELEIVLFDARAILHFLQLDHVLFLLRRACRLGFLELELAVVHDLDHGGARRRRHFHQVQTALSRYGQCLFDGQYTQLAAVIVDDSHGADADHPVYADPPLAITGGQWQYLPFRKTETPDRRSGVSISRASAAPGGAPRQD